MLRNRTDGKVSQKETSGAHEACKTSGSQIRSGPPKSTEQWELALNFAEQCLNKFLEPVLTVEDVEKQSREAIALLTKRHVHNVCTFYKALFCDFVLVSV
jgi:hypothetical protein